MEGKKTEGLVADGGSLWRGREGLRWVRKGDALFGAWGGDEVCWRRSRGLRRSEERRRGWGFRPRWSLGCGSAEKLWELKWCEVGRGN